jgi:rhodanese-related sulfurtransferase
MHLSCQKFAYPVFVLPFEISVADVAQMRTAQTPFVLLDVREPWEVSTASIAGSKDIPMNDIPARANNELDPDTHIVVVCHHGARSLSVTAWLRREGFDNVQSMAGGIDQWSREIDGSVPRY